MKHDKGRAALGGVRVAEFGSGRALAYCGKLFADFGADVVKVEPPGGDPDGAMAPLVDAGGGAQESARLRLAEHQQAQRRRRAEDDAARLVEIAGGVDVLIDAPRRRLGRWRPGRPGRAAGGRSRG